MATFGNSSFRFEFYAFCFAFLLPVFRVIWYKLNQQNSRNQEIIASFTLLLHYFLDIKQASVNI